MSKIIRGILAWLVPLCELLFSPTTEMLERTSGTPTIFWRSHLRQPPTPISPNSQRKHLPPGGHYPRIPEFSRFRLAE
ncbi:hypothetical protein BGX38DRAFT_511573 [Terfezia claveryi]|nr:hypothetical protein BGX38DRAFT_511573 [Terfezia claveryi]